jgi:hypothetical protein
MAKKESSLKGSGYSAEQSKAAQQMADAMEKMARFAPTIERSFITQADVLSKMTASMQAFAGQQTVDNLTKICDALKCISDNIGAIDPSKLAALGTQAGSTQTIIVQMTESVKSLNQNVQGIDSKSINKFSESTKKAGKQVQSVTKNEFGSFKDLLKSKFPIAAGVAGGALSGLVQGFRNLMALSKGLFGFISTLTKSLFKIGATLISIPMKIFDGLINMADQGGGGISELAEAINGMRKEFGALAGPTNSAIMGTAKAMGNLHIAGTSVLRVFGNQADRLKMLTELYAQSGSNLRGFAKEILATNGAALALQKGLGLTAENMESFAARAKSTGQPLTKMLVNVTKQADQMGKAFGLDAKIISKEMGKAAQDFKNFGNVSEKQLAVAVTYAEKLGLKLDKITGTMDAFGTFDDAADNVSKLNEAFGTNIDAMEILQAQSPEEKMEILRREMRKAGVEGEKLNAAQRKLIAGASGMDDQTAIAALSTKNYGVSLSNIKKEGDKAEKKTLTQAEAIDKLADAMERMLKSGESGLTGGKGLLGAFLNGITRGIQMHPDFINMMRSIKQTIYQVFAGGIKVGRDFVDLFPGIKGMLQSITKIFDPAKVAALMTRVSDIFKQFFTDLSDPNKKGSVSALMTKLKDAFFNFFDKKSPEGSELLGHFGKFKDAIVKIFSELAVWMIEKLAGIITSITEWIKNPKMPKVDGSGAANSILSPFQEVIQKAGDVLWPAIKDLGLTIWEKLKSALMDPANKKYLYGAMATIAAVVLGPALVQGIAGGITGALAKKALGGEGGGGVVGMVKDIFAGGDAEKAVAEAAEGAGAQAAKGGASFLESPAELVKSALPDKDTIEQMEAASKASINWAALADFLLGMAGMFAIGLAAFKVALEIVKGTSIADLGKAALVMGVLIPVMQGMSELVGPLSEIKDVPFGALIKTLVGVAALMLVGLGALWLALKVVKGVPLMDIIKAGIAVGAVGFMMSEMPGIFLAIKMVSKTMDKAGGPAKMAIALIAMGVTIIAMAGVAWVAIKMLGKFSLAAVATTVAAVAAMELLFAGAGALLVVAGAVGAAASGPQILMAAVGFAAMAVAIIALAKVAQITIKMLGGFSIAQVGVTVAALTGMELLMAGAAALIVVAGAIGAAIIASFGAGAAAIVLGTKALDKAIVKISDTAVELINKLGEIPMGKVTTTLTIMSMSLLLFGEAGLLIVEAAAIGATIISTLGVGAAAIKVGMETITSAVNTMAGTVVGVMLDLEKIKEDPSAVEAKANAFSSILSAISELVDSIAGIIDSFDFGFFDDPEDIATKVGSVQSFIESLIEGRDGKGGIKGIVDSITQGLKEVSSESLERGKAIAEILSATGTLMETMVGPAMELSKQAGGMWKSSKKQAEDAKLLIGNVIEFIEKLSPQISGLVTTITGTLKQLTPEQVTALEKGGPAVAAILTAVGKLVEVVKPGNVNIQGLNTVGPQGQAAGVTLTQQAPNIQEVFKAAIEFLPALFVTIIKLIAASPTGEEFEKKAESAKKIFEVIGPVVDMIKSITDIAKDKDFKWDDAREKSKEMLKGIEGYLFQLFAGNAGTIQGVLGHIFTLGEHLKAGSETSKTVEELAGPTMTAIKNVIEKLDDVLRGELPDREMAKKYLKDAEGYLFQLIAGEGTIQGVLSKLNEIKTHIGGADSKSIVEGLNNFNETLKSASSAVELMGTSAQKFESAKGNADALKNNFGNFTESLKTVEGVFSGFTGIDNSKIIPAFQNMLLFGVKITKATDLLLVVFSEDSSSNAEKLMKNISNVKAMIENGIVPAAAAVKDMMRAAAEIENAIGQGANFDINKKLKVFTANSQKFLGSGGKYTVTTKDVNINVNFKVVIDSEELSSTIVQNKNSVIRQRINLLMSAVRDDESAKAAKDEAAKARFTGTEVPKQLVTYQD